MEPINVEALSQYVGKLIGVSRWKTVTPELISQYADTINDHNKIHLDDAFAQSRGLPKAIAHGYLVVSLIPELLMELITFESGILNYGGDNLVFKKPVVAGAAIRLEAGIFEHKALRHGITKVTFDIKIYSEWEDKEELAVVFQPIFLFIKK